MRHHGSIDADQFPCSIDQGPARVSGVHRGIRLQEAFNGALLVNDVNVAAFGTDDARGHGAGEVERIAHRQDPLTEADIIGIGHLYIVQFPCLNLQ